MRYLLLTLVLTGCSTIPSPEVPIPERNAQVRLTQVVGDVEGGVGGTQGSSCILSILGRLPVGAVTAMQQGTCMVQIAGQPETEK